LAVRGGYPLEAAADGGVCVTMNVSLLGSNDGRMAMRLMHPYAWNAGELTQLCNPPRRQHPALSRRSRRPGDQSP
jgi:hypothetical protein